ncbi:mpv17-like protein [Daktulosphaira vitifoliae]|uniref:mpv17-like protein n=1 Tax=Daktulosphaira vitifoliae TaxID=58002 RepID=UPI0021A9FEAC|nr:mpv17-like protein [Daktulosphaira vitifoliae]
MSKVLTLIKETFKKYPMLANSTVYGTMCVGAELSQQIITKRILNKTEPPKPIDKEVLGRYAVIGTLISPNILYFWYKWLDKAFVGTAPKIIVKKMLLDQFLMTPPLYVIFYVSMSLMEGKKDLLEECRQKFIPTFKTSCVFWLPAQAINFLMVPPPARVIYVGTCSFIWINMLCWIKRNDYNTVKEQ